jgi:hypothetical protein
MVTAALAVLAVQQFSDAAERVRRRVVPLAAPQHTTSIYISAGDVQKAGR